MEQKIRLVIGYGNPGKRYVNARNNVGCIVIDSAVQNAINIFPTATVRNWEIRSKYMILAINLDPFTFVVKSRTFESKFDDTAVSLYRFYKLDPENFYIILPDENISVGHYLVDKSSDSVPEAVTKIENQISSKDFWKVRIGIGGTNEELNEIDQTKVKYLGKRLARELELINLTSKKPR